MKKFSNFNADKTNENNLDNALSKMVNIDSDALDILKKVIGEIKELKENYNNLKKEHNDLKKLVYGLKDEMDLEEPEN